MKVRNLLWLVLGFTLLQPVSSVCARDILPISGAAQLHSRQQPVQLQEPAIIEGVVTDADGQTLPGAGISLSGSNLGTVADIDGRFHLELPQDPERKKVTLRIEYIGKMTRYLDWNGEKFLLIRLEDDDHILDEVVVTGYQRIDKRELTSAVAVVKSDELKVIGASSVEDMLQGQLPGLSVVNSSAGPGAVPRVRVRGTATIMGTAEPLWVLDGVILENPVPLTVEELNNPDVMNTFNSAIGGVSPKDIESITVLKDASATAIYGTRAANGVIVVTTKNGLRNGFNLSYHHTSSWALRPAYRDFDLLDSQERVTLAQQMFDDGLELMGDVGLESEMLDYLHGNTTREDFVREVQAMELRNTDWFKLLFRNAYTHTHNLSVSGGGERMDYYVSMNYNGENGAAKVTGYRNFNGLAKVNAELFKGVKLGVSLQAGKIDRDSYHSSVDPFEYAVSTSRTIPVYDEKGGLFFYKGLGFDDDLKFNILNEQQNTSYNSTQTDVKALGNLEVKIWKGLKYRGMASWNQSTSKAVEYAKERSRYAGEIRGYEYGEGAEAEQLISPMPYGGTYEETDYRTTGWMVRNQLEYSGKVGGKTGGKVSLDAMLGQEFRTTTYDGTETEAYGYMHDRGEIFFEPQENDNYGHLLRNKVYRKLQTRSNISWYGVFSAMYDERYVLNANIRFDGSNLFGALTRHRYQPLWSVSGKWNISNEEFMASATQVDHLALRASYGWRGNIVDGSTPQIVATMLPPNPSTGEFEMGIGQVPNPDLRWEKTSSLNIGLEMSFFNGRLAVDLDGYYDYSTDLIAPKAISSVTGFKTKYLNYADVCNGGLDLNLSGDIFRKKDFSWRSTLTFGWVHNEVIHAKFRPTAQNLVGSMYVPGEVVEGKPLDGLFSYRFAGLDKKGMPLFYTPDNEVSEGWVGSDNQAEVDRFIKEIYSNPDNLQFEGSRNPVLSGGWNNILRYKDFTFSFLFTYGLKYVVRLPEMAYISSPHADQNANRSIMDRWRKPGDEAHTDIPKLSEGANHFEINGKSYHTTSMFNKSTATVAPGDYLRLKNLMIEYRLPQSLLRKALIGGRSPGEIAFKFQAENLFVLADRRLKGYDPETINYTTNGYGAMPLLRTFTLGLSLTF